MSDVKKVSDVKKKIQIIKIVKDKYSYKAPTTSHPLSHPFQSNTRNTDLFLYLSQEQRQMAGPHTHTPSNPSNYSEPFLSTGVSQSTRTFSTSITFYKSLYTFYSLEYQSAVITFSVSFFPFPKQLVFIRQGRTLIFETGNK